jgi:hypothetical protein
MRYTGDVEKPRSGAAVAVDVAQVIVFDSAAFKRQ